MRPQRGQLPATLFDIFAKKQTENRHQSRFFQARKRNLAPVLLSFTIRTSNLWKSDYQYQRTGRNSNACVIDFGRIFGQTRARSLMDDLDSAKTAWTYMAKII
jgi:hypothetical protein